MKKFLLISLLLVCYFMTGNLAQAETVKIASWNIAWLNHESNTGKVKRKDKDYDILKEYAKQLDADLVALQEVENARAAMRVFDNSEYSFYFTNDSGVQRTGFAYKKHLKIKAHSDYTALNVGNVRSGADITLTVNGQDIRILGVHLKSSCHEDPLNTNTTACRKLEKQMHILEDWIDERAKENIPFIVIGDFNRRMEKGEEFWVEIDDSKPKNSDLTSFSIKHNLKSDCWCGKYPKYIDHIVFDALAVKYVKPGSFGQMRYNKGCKPKAVISDHCPVFITLNIN